MADRVSFTKMQRHILWLLRDGRAAAFMGGKGSRDGLNCWDSRFGTVIKAYGSPEFFLTGRGLLEPVASNAPGRWHRLTSAGLERAARVQHDLQWRMPDAFTE